MTQPEMYDSYSSDIAANPPKGTQQYAIDKMLSGANVFLTGEPGAGKTYTLNEFVRQAYQKGKRIAITASTGIAASHISGTTIHSWSSLGIKDSIRDDEIDRMAFQPGTVEKYNMADILIIDEISMLHGSRLDMVNRVAKWLRSNNKPFGGLQVIFVGDLFQLPPVTKGTDVVDFVHLSEAWAEAAPETCYLTEQHRQGADDALLTVLREKRAGYLNHIVNDLSGEIYGNMMSPTEAMAVITEGITLNSSGQPKGNGSARKSKKLQRQNRKKGRS